MFGRALRQVSTLDWTWLALLGWRSGALRVAVDDRWIDWSRQQKLRRLHLIAQNVRFVILPAAEGRKNLASRVLGLSLRRLSHDIVQAQGHAVLLAESFLDRARNSGTCYRAANWQPLGFTSGYARQRGPTARWQHHGQPKQVPVYPLASNVQALLSQPEEQGHWFGPPKDPPAPAAVLGSLFESLQQLPHCRSSRGRGYPLASLLCLAASAHRAGYRGVTAYSQCAELLSQPQSKAAGCLFNSRLRRYSAPVPSTFHKALVQGPAEVFEGALEQASPSLPAHSRSASPDCSAQELWRALGSARTAQPGPKMKLLLAAKEATELERVPAQELVLRQRQCAALVKKLQSEQQQSREVRQRSMSLQNELENLRNELQSTRAELQQAHTGIGQLKSSLAEQTKTLFGHKSEKPPQPAPESKADLGSETDSGSEPGPAGDPDKPSKKRKRRCQLGVATPPRRKRSHLPNILELFELPEEERRSGEYGKSYVPCGTKGSTIFEIDLAAIARQTRGLVGNEADG